MALFDIFSGIFGGSKSKSSQLSENQAYPMLSKALEGNIGQGNNAMSILGSLLGLGDPTAGKATLGNFLDSTGFNFLLDTGSKAITGNAASRGLLNSGYTGKALTNFGQDLGMTKLSELVDKLTTLGNYGLESANTISGAGVKQTAQSSGKDYGKGAFNSLFPGGLSDRRTKTNIRRVGTFDDGLGIYDFEYIFAPGKVFRGVMADEVARLRPEALGPKFGKYQTVNYAAILGLQNGPILKPEPA